MKPNQNETPEMVSSSMAVSIKTENVVNDDGCICARLGSRRCGLHGSGEKAGYDKAY